MKKILIIDDSAFFRRILRDALATDNIFGENIRVEIFEADGKKAALEQIQANIPELILLDVVMRDNEHEGVQILEDVHKKHPLIRVIVISSVGQESVINKCKNFGVKDYIEKPFDNDKLISAIRKNLSED